MENSDFLKNVRKKNTVLNMVLTQCLPLFITFQQRLKSNPGNRTGVTLRLCAGYELIN
jgi:hypothetical protein